MRKYISRNTESASTDRTTSHDQEVLYFFCFRLIRACGRVDSWREAEIREMWWDVRLANQNSGLRTRLQVSKGDAQPHDYLKTFLVFRRDSIVGGNLEGLTR